MVRDDFLGGVNMNLVFNSDICEPSAKTKGRGDKDIILLIL